MKNSNSNNKNGYSTLKEILKNIIPIDLEFICNLSEKAFNFYSSRNSFIIFKSLDDRIYIAFSTTNSLIIYNFYNQQIENEIKFPHKYFITSLRHCIYNKKNIIMTVSPSEKSIKLWDLHNCRNIINIKDFNSECYILSSCFLNYNNETYILSSSVDYNYELNPEPINVFDFKGNKIKEIKNSKEHTFYIDTYYDNDKSKYYIITGNNNFIKSYDYEKNEIYHKYKSVGSHYHFIIYQEEKKAKIIASSNNNRFIVIWNFHECILLHKIEVFGAEGNFGLCLFNEKFLFGGGLNGEINIIDLNNGEIKKEILGHQSRVFNIQIFMHPIFGRCAVSQGWYSEPIKLWKIKY